MAAINPSTIPDSDKQKLLRKSGTSPSSDLTDQPVLLNIPYDCDVFSDLSITAKSVVFDITDNQGDATYLGVRSIEFYSGSNLLEFASTDFTTYATSSNHTGHDKDDAFDTSLSKTGAGVGTSWAVASTGSERLIVVFDTEQIFTKIVINNYHDSGSETDYGIETVTITSSTDSITSTTFEGAIANSTELFTGDLPIHTGADAADDEIAVDYVKKLAILDKDDDQCPVEIEYWNYDSGTPANNVGVLHVLLPSIPATPPTYDASLCWDAAADDNTEYVGDTGDAEVPHYPTAHNATYVKATSDFGANYYPYYATNPSLSLTGSANLVSWISSTDDPQKFNIDLGSAKTIKRVRLENAHFAGATPEHGIKNFILYGTNDSTAFANTTYATTTDLTALGTFQADAHVSSDVPDPQYFKFENLTAYRYYVLRIADNHGHASYMGIRHIEMQQGVPAQRVWPSDYEARWGMSQDPSGTAPQLLDSTSNGYDGTMAGTMLTEDLVDGLVGKGWDFDGTDDSVTTASALGLTAYPIVFFSKFELDNLTAIQPLISGDDASNYIGLSVWIDTNGAVNVRLGDGAGVTSADHYTWKTANSVIAATTEYTLELLVTNFTTVVLYIDGSAETLSFSAGTGASADLSNALYRIGTSAADSAFIDGQIYDIFLGSFALTTDQASLQSLSLTDTLFDWSDYTSYISNIQFWNIQYDNLLEDNVAYWNEVYSIFFPRVQSWDEIYGILLTTYWNLPYGNNPLLSKYWDERYGDNPIIRQWFDLRYDDRVSLLKYWDEKYNLNKGILQHWNEGYAILGKELVKYFDENYDIKNTNPVLKHFDEYYHIMADSVVEAAALGFYIDGVKYEGPYHASFELNVDSYKNTGEMHFNYPTPFFAASEGTEMRIVDTDIDLYLDITIPTKRETVRETTYIIPGESKSRRLEIANVFTEDFENTTAETIVTTVANREGITVDWQIPDWPLELYSVNDQTPYQVIYDLVSNTAKAVIQSDFNGDIYITKAREANTNEYDTATPTYLLEDNLHFFSTNQRGERKPGYNKYRATDQSESDEVRTTLEDDEYGVASRIVKAFRVPWDGVALTLYTSDNNANILYQNIVTEELTEAISVVNGEGDSNTSKPFYSLVSWSYNDTDLGTPTVTEEGIVQTPTDGQSLLTITYLTKYYKWLVTDYDDKEIQVWVE